MFSNAKNLTDAQKLRRTPILAAARNQASAMVKEVRNNLADLGLSVWEIDKDPVVLDYTKIFEDIDVQIRQMTRY